MKLVPAIIMLSLCSAVGVVIAIAQHNDREHIPARYHVECTMGKVVDVYDDTPDLALFHGGRIEVNGITYSQGAACKFWNMKRPETTAVVVPRNKFD